MKLEQVSAMMDDTKELVVSTSEEVGEISRKHGVPFRKVYLDFVARAIVAGRKVSEMEGGEGRRAFEADLQKTLDSYEGA